MYAGITLDVHLRKWRNVIVDKISEFVEQFLDHGRAEVVSDDLPQVPGSNFIAGFHI